MLKVTVAVELVTETVLVLYVHGRNLDACGPVQLKQELPHTLASADQDPGNDSA